MQRTWIQSRFSFHPSSCCLTSVLVPLNPKLIFYLRHDGGERPTKTILLTEITAQVKKSLINLPSCKPSKLSLVLPLSVVRLRFFPFPLPSPNMSAHSSIKFSARRVSALIAAVTARCRHFHRLYGYSVLLKAWLRVIVVDWDSLLVPLSYFFLISRYIIRILTVCWLECFFWFWFWLNVFAVAATICFCCFLPISLYLAGFFLFCFSFSFYIEIVQFLVSVLERDLRDSLFPSSISSSRICVMTRRSDLLSVSVTAQCCVCRIKA